MYGLKPMQQSLCTHKTAGIFLLLLVGFNFFIRKKEGLGLGGGGGEGEGHLGCQLYSFGVLPLSYSSTKAPPYLLGMPHRNISFFLDLQWMMPTVWPYGATSSCQEVSSQPASTPIRFHRNSVPLFHTF